jgi:hypothetical protein
MAYRKRFKSRFKMKRRTRRKYAKQRSTPRTFRSIGFRM